jgi:hypothetical protein
MWCDAHISPLLGRGHRHETGTSQHRVSDQRLSKRPLKASGMGTFPRPQVDDSTFPEPPPISIEPISGRKFNSGSRPWLVGGVNRAPRRCVYPSPQPPPPTGEGEPDGIFTPQPLFRPSVAPLSRWGRGVGGRGKREYEVPWPPSIDPLPSAAKRQPERF